MAEDPNIDQLFEMAIASKPYLRTALERMRASIATLDNPSANQGFAEYLRVILVADHSEALKMIDEKRPGL